MDQPTGRSVLLPAECLALSLRTALLQRDRGDKRAVELLRCLSSVSPKDTVAFAGGAEFAPQSDRTVVAGANATIIASWRHTVN